MTNFTARIRTHYSDIDGLVLDCRPSGLADDGSLWINQSPPARSLDKGTHQGADGAASLFDPTKTWRTNQLVGKVAYNLSDGSAGLVTGNTEHEVVAALAGGTDDDWDVSDSYVITTPRFSNPYQDIEANRPVVSTVGGVKQAAFTRASSHFLKIPLERSFLEGHWTLAFDYFQGADTANLQTMIGFDELEVFRRDATGDYGFRYDVMSGTGSGDMADGAWMLAHLEATSAKLYRNGVLSISGPGVPMAIDADDPAGFIGCLDGVSQFCDMTLRSLQIWNRPVAPIEVDFAFQSLNPESDYSAERRASIERRVWTDDTATIPRINPHRVAPHRFALASLASGRNRVQIAAMVGGHTLPDSALGGKLFEMTPLETPGTPPAVYQDAGWSSVFDIAVEDEGHYAYCLSREDGGAVVLHFDAEAA